MYNGVKVMLKGKVVVVGVTGSIAAYKSAQLVKRHINPPSLSATW